MSKCRVTALCLFMLLALASCHHVAQLAAIKAPTANPAPLAHPRLYFTSKDLPELRRKVTSPFFAERFARLRQYVDARPFVEKPSDDRGLFSNPDMICESFVALITEDPKYIARARRQLLQAASWDVEIWRGGITPTNTAVGLGLGHFSQAVAISYDWMYPFLTPSERQTVLRALGQKSLSIYKSAIERNDPQEWSLTLMNNWCPVIHGGVGIAALATLDEIPDSPWVFETARKRLRGYLTPLPKDGGYVEGVMYAQYAVTSAVLFAAAMERVTGSDDGIFEDAGIRNAGLFLRCFTGPDNAWVNFSNCQTIIDISGVWNVLIGRYGDHALDAYYQRYEWRKRASPWEFIFRPDWPAPDDQAFAPTGLTVFPEAQWAAFRSPRIYLGFKSGNSGLGHRHLDLNSFILFLDGQRLTTTAPYGKVQTLDHSTILVNGQSQARNSTGTITEFGTIGRLSFITAQADSAYGSDLTSFVRTAFILPDQVVIIADTLKGKAGNRYDWRVQAGNQPVIDPDGRRALIPGTAHGLEVQLVLPGKATLTTTNTYGPCLSAQHTAAGTDAVYFAVFTPQDVSANAHSTTNGVQVTLKQETYTFTLTAHGWTTSGKPTNVGPIYTPGERLQAD